MEAFNAEYYVIYFFLAFFSLLISIKMDLKGDESRLPKLYVIPILLFIIYLFGSRDKEIGADTGTYAHMFANAQHVDFGIEFLNAFLFRTFNSITNQHQVLFYVYSAIFVTVYTFSIRGFALLFNSNLALMLFAGICVFTFKNMGINIMRQGVAISFFLLGLSLFLKKNKWSYLFFFISVGFHGTSAILIFIVLLQPLYKKIGFNMLYIFYLISIVLSYFAIGVKNIASLVDLSILDERRTEGYLNSTYDVYETGFKLNFVIFNTVFLALFVFIRQIVLNDYYDWLLRLFITTSMVFFFMFEIPFSDRWGLFSWVLIPILLGPAFTPYFKYKLATVTTSFLILIFAVFEYILWN